MLRTAKEFQKKINSLCLTLILAVFALIGKPRYNLANQTIIELVEQLRPIKNEGEIERFKIALDELSNDSGLLKKPILDLPSELIQKYNSARCQWRVNGDNEN